MKFKKLYFAVPITGALLYLYYRFNPAKYSFFPKCPFHYLTGWDCPGCGSQRAVNCLLHLDVMGALHQNLLLVTSLPFLAVHFGYRLAGIIRHKDYRWSVIYHPATPIITGIIAVTFWVVRNLPFYPFKH